MGGDCDGEITSDATPAPAAPKHHQRPVTHYQALHSALLRMVAQPLTQ